MVVQYSGQTGLMILESALPPRRLRFSFRHPTELMDNTAHPLVGIVVKDMGESGMGHGRASPQSSEVRRVKE